MTYTSKVENLRPLRSKFRILSLEIRHDEYYDVLPLHEDVFFTMFSADKNYAVTQNGGRWRSEVLNVHFVGNCERLSYHQL